MNIEHISGGVFWTPFVIICFIITLVAFIAVIAVQPVLDKLKIERVGILDGVSVEIALACITIVAFLVGLFAAFGANLQAADTNFAEKLQSDYGLTTEASFNDVRNSATFNTIVVFADDDSKFEVRPHLDGDTMTFFRVDNDTELKPNSK